MTYKISILLCSLLVALTLQGCFTMQRNDYCVKMIYSQNIDVIAVKYGNNPYIRGGSVLSVHVVPKTATIEWENKSTGKIFKKTIPIKSKIPSDFNFNSNGDELIIHVNDNDSVNLTFKISPQLYRWIEYDENGKEIARSGFWPKPPFPDSPDKPKAVGYSKLIGNNFSLKLTSSLTYPDNNKYPVLSAIYTQDKPGNEFKTITIEWKYGKKNIDYFMPGAIFKVKKIILTDKTFNGLFQVIGEIQISERLVDVTGFFEAVEGNKVRINPEYIKSVRN